MVKEYRNNGQRTLDESKFDKLTDRVRKVARELGWSSYAEMVVQERKRKHLRNERKIQRFEQRIIKEKKC